MTLDFHDIHKFQESIKVYLKALKKGICLPFDIHNQGFAVSANLGSQSNFLPPRTRFSTSL
jgi:hypothetical protein